MLLLLMLTLLMALAVGAKDFIAVRPADYGIESKSRSGHVKQQVKLGSYSFSLIDDKDDGDEDTQYYENVPVELAHTSSWLQSDVDWNIRYLNISSINDDATADDSDDRVLVYIVDTGTRQDHEAFSQSNPNNNSNNSRSSSSRSRVLAGHSATHLAQARGWEDCHGHGTHVSSIAAGNLPHGIAHQASIVPVAIFGCNGQGSLMDLIEGVNWIIQDLSSRQSTKKIRAVVNLSLQTQHSTIIDLLMEELWRAGVLIVVAAGNSRGGGRDACDYSPASSTRVIAVGALTQDLSSIMSSTNLGSCVDLYVPGQNIWGAWPLTTNHYASMSGTSQAAPHVTGLAALLWHRYPALTRDVLHAFLLTTAIRSIPVLDLYSVNTSTYVSALPIERSSTVSIRLTPRRWNLLDGRRGFTQCTFDTGALAPMTLFLATRHLSNFVVRASVAYKNDGRYVVRMSKRRLVRRPSTAAKRVIVGVAFGRRAELSENPDGGVLLTLPYTTMFIRLTRRKHGSWDDTLICK